MKRIFFAATMLLSLASIAQVQNRQEMIRSQNLQKSWVKNIPFQALEIGRGAGEIIQVERNPNNPYELYVALAESGVWYSENNGASFSPTFADFMTPQADAMAVDWDNHTLWVANHQGVFFKEQGKDWQATSPVGNILVRLPKHSSLRLGIALSVLPILLLRVSSQVSIKVITLGLHGNSSRVQVPVSLKGTSGKYP